jgi:hypothetical protein
LIASLLVESTVTMAGGLGSQFSNTVVAKWVVRCAGIHIAPSLVLSQKSRVMLGYFDDSGNPIER